VISITLADGAAASSQLAARRIARPIARIFGDHLATAGLSESQYLLLAQLLNGPLGPEGSAAIHAESQLAAATARRADRIGTFDRRSQPAVATDCSRCAAF